MVGRILLLNGFKQLQTVIKYKNYFGAFSACRAFSLLDLHAPVSQSLSGRLYCHSVPQRGRAVASFDFDLN